MAHQSSGLTDASNEAWQGSLSQVKLGVAEQSTAPKN